MKGRRKDTETCIATILFLKGWGKDLIAREMGKLPQIVLRISYLEYNISCLDVSKTKRASGNSLPISVVRETNPILLSFTLHQSIEFCAHAVLPRMVFQATCARSREQLPASSFADPARSCWHRCVAEPGALTQCSSIKHNEFL